MNELIAHNVELGSDHSFGPFCVIGQEDGETTVIGDRANVRSHTVIYGGNTIGDNFQTGHHVMIREDNKIGDNVSVGTGSNIEHHVTIEDEVRIHSGCFIPEFCHLKRGAWIGPRVCMTNARYPQSKRVKDELEGVTVGENAKIGANVTIMPGVHIGKNAIVGAGSVVTKDVPDDSVAIGSPAKVVKKVSDLKYSDGEDVYPN